MMVLHAGIADFVRFRGWLAKICLWGEGKGGRQHSATAAVFSADSSGLLTTFRSQASDSP